MNRLAKYIIIIAVCALIFFIGWYFSTILTCILIAAVVSLVGQPIMRLLGRIKIKGCGMGKSLAATFTIIILLCTISAFFYLLFPLVGSALSQVSSIDLDATADKLAAPLQNLNREMHTIFPTMESTITVQSLAADHIRELLNFNIFTNAFSSITTFLVNFMVGLFTVVFVTFFFLQDNNTFIKMILAFVPERYHHNTRRAISSIIDLLARYFTGITVETILITLLNTIGLHFICGLPMGLSVVLAFVSGILNVIPYIGPWIGGAIGTIVGLFSLYETGLAPDIVNLFVKFVAVFSVTHLLDLFIFQPYIYSSSVKAHPLEIFLIIMVGGQVAGILGMLIAVPAYTSIRVFAVEFFSETEMVRRLFMREDQK